MKMVFRYSVFLLFSAIASGQGLAAPPCPPLLAGGTFASTETCATPSVPVEGHFVDAVSGDDSNDGRSYTSAWKSLTKARNTLGATATAPRAWLKAGTAHDNKSIVISSSGSASEHTIFGCYHVLNDEAMSC